MPRLPVSTASVPYCRARAVRTAAASLAAMLAGSLAMAAATSDDSTGFYVQGGESFGQGRDSGTLFVGVMLARDRGVPEGLVTSYWDLFYGQWRGRQANGVHRSFNQLGATLMWRKRVDDNRSAWFGEGGLGIATLDGDYSIPDGRILGSRTTFHWRLGIGHSFGARAEHELSLNYQHFSNGGIKKPNPGIDLVQLRYAYRF